MPRWAREGIEPSVIFLLIHHEKGWMKNLLKHPLLILKELFIFLVIQLR